MITDNSFTLHDPCAAGRNPDMPRTIAGTIESDDCTVTFRFKGHSSNDQESYGEIICVEYYNGIVKVHVYSDINVEGPTDSISMDGAREGRRYSG